MNAQTIAMYWPKYARWRNEVKTEYKHYLTWCKTNNIPPDATLTFDQYAQRDLFTEEQS